MIDRIDEILRPVETSVSNSTSSDSYIARGLAKLVPEIEATNRKIINVKPENVTSISNLPPKEHPVETYEPRLVTIGKRGSVGLSKSPDQIASTSPVQLFRLDDVNPLPSNKMGQLVEYRSGKKSKKPGSRQKELALVA